MFQWAGLKGALQMQNEVLPSATEHGHYETAHVFDLKLW